MIRPVGVVALVITLVAGCGDGSDADATSPPVNGARPVDIRAEALAFEPQVLTVAAGEDLAVTLVSGDIAHDLTLDESGFRLRVDAGDTDTAALRVDTPGTYTAYCSIPGHREAGMELTIEAAP